MSFDLAHRLKLASGRRAPSQAPLANRQASRSQGCNLSKANLERHQSGDNDRDARRPFRLAANRSTHINLVAAATALVGHAFSTLASVQNQWCDCIRCACHYRCAAFLGFSEAIFFGQRNVCLDCVASMQADTHASSPDWPFATPLSWQAVSADSPHSCVNCIVLRRKDGLRYAI